MANIIAILLGAAFLLQACAIDQYRRHSATIVDANGNQISCTRCDR